MTIEAVRKTRVIKAASLEKVIVDKTVMENTIAYRTDSRLPECARQYLVKLAGVLGISLCRNYDREAPNLRRRLGGMPTPNNADA